MPGELYKEWPWIKLFGMVTSEKTVDSELDKETRYFVSSLYDNAKYFLKACKDHWGVENGLHWRLDVDFQEDDARKRKNAATNFSSRLEHGARRWLAVAEPSVHFAPPILLMRKVSSSASSLQRRSRQRVMQNKS